MTLKPWIPRADTAIELGTQSHVFLIATRILGPFYSRFVLRLDRIVFEGREALVAEYERAVRNEGRFVIAYRHPGDSDPHLVFYALTELLKNEAPSTGADNRPGAWYPSGKEAQLWAGKLVLWALHNAGIVPVRHGSVDRSVIDYLVGAVAERPRPMAIAPEGMATYHRDRVPELEPGTARIAFMARERLAREGKHIPVRILPVAIDYDYSRTTPPARLDTFLSKLEKRVGIQPRPAADPAANVTAGERSARERILAVWERLLESAEAAYERSWGIKALPKEAGLAERGIHLAEESTARLEAYYGVTPAQTLKSRILNIRAEAIERVLYTAAEMEKHSAVERSMAARGAAEAFYLDKIYLAAALLQFLDPAYIDEPCDFDRLVETAQNLHDLANRLEGKDMKSRSKFFRKDARIIVGPAFEVDRLEGESRKDAVDRAQAKLKQSLEKLIGK